MKHVIARESHYSTAMDAKGLEHMEENVNIFRTRFSPSEPFIVKNETEYRLTCVESTVIVYVTKLHCIRKNVHFVRYKQYYHLTIKSIFGKRKVHF